MNIDQLLTVSATISVILVFAASIILILSSKGTAAPTKSTPKSVPQEKQKSYVVNGIYSHDGKLIFFGDIGKPLSGKSLGDTVTHVKCNFSFFKK